MKNRSAFEPYKPSNCSGTLEQCFIPASARNFIFCNSAKHKTIKQLFRKMPTPWMNQSALGTCSRIIALNNEGATSLSSGDMALSISTFCQALRESRACLVSQHGERTSQTREEKGGSFFNCHNYNQCENEGAHSFGNQEDRQSQSPSVPNFDIGHLMETDCFGLISNGESDNSCSVLDSSNNAASKAFSISTYSTLQITQTAKDGKYLEDKILVEGGFIYRKPIRIPPSYAHNTSLQNSEVTLPSIVIFNLALAHHLLAMKKKNEPCKHLQPNLSSLLLEKSAKLYELAIQLQERQVAADGTQSFSNLFYLSCVNNLGSSYRLLGDISLSEKTYQQLLTMIVYLNYSEEQRGYELSTMDTVTSVSNVAWSARQQNISTSTFSAGRTYGSFFRNIFQGQVKSAPAA